MSKFQWILDAGEGIETKGKESPIWNNNTQLNEWEFNRNVVRYLSFMLRDSKIDYTILVHEINDASLSERVRRANAINKDSIFVSVHGNSFTDSRVHGFETHYYNAGKEYAEIFQKYTGQLGRDRGIKKSNSYAIKNTKMPAILTKNGFYSNEKECAKMLTNDFQYEIAEAHYRAILEIENNEI